LIVRARTRRHLADSCGRHRAGTGQAEQHVGAGQHLVGRAAQPAIVRPFGERCAL
jgi:hypothetical protein